MPDNGRRCALEGGSYGTLRGACRSGRRSGAPGTASRAVTGLHSPMAGASRARASRSLRPANLGYTFGDDQEVRAYLSGGYIHQQIPGSLSLAQALNTSGARQPGQRHAELPARQTRPCAARCRRAGGFDANTVFEGGVYATQKELDHPIFQVIDQESDNWGVFGRIDWTGEFFGLKADLFYGLSYRSGENRREAVGERSRARAAR